MAQIVKWMTKTGFGESDSGDKSEPPKRPEPWTSRPNASGHQQATKQGPTSLKSATSQPPPQSATAQEEPREQARQAHAPPAEHAP